MLCFVALAVFLFLSIFSAKYRPLAKRALECAARKVTLRPCDTGLDEEIKAASISGIMKISPRAAEFTNKHFEAFSLAFSILFFLSLIFMVQGFYYFVIYGNCNGPEGGFCIYSGLQNEALLVAPTSLAGISAGNASANITLIEFGCYTCPYTKAAESGVREIISKYGDKVHYVYKAFPLPSHPYSHEAALAALCANQEGKYWEYRALLFENQAYVKENGAAALYSLARNLNLTGFEACYTGNSFEPEIKAATDECTASRIYGTPTFFVNGKPYVGQNAMNRTMAEVERLVG
ncbi:MAG: thioredoxin domain-containing protein [Candidatus Micrarchaeota archaeon]|nr:thioredoxin domain-containing protein [Candidatus Micrarchaeota archaeon]